MNVQNSENDILVFLKIIICSLIGWGFSYLAYITIFGTILNHSGIGTYFLIIFLGLPLHLGATIASFLYRENLNVIMTNLCVSVFFMLLSVLEISEVANPLVVFLWLWNLGALILIISGLRFFYFLLHFFYFFQNTEVKGSVDTSSFQFMNLKLGLLFIILGGMALAVGLNQLHVFNT